VRDAVGAATALLIAGTMAMAPDAAADEARALPQSALRSGITFAGADVRAMQDDDFANPGMLWVDRGAREWQQAPAGAQSCAQCHGDAGTSMRGVAARYPAFDTTAGAMLDLEARINDCRVRRQKQAPWARESEPMLALTALIATQSRGLPMAVVIDGPAHATWQRGRDLYYARHGQMNIACAQCHEQNWSKRLYQETLSQGHGNAFPAYRLEWQSLGSLQRRIRACLYGVRAEMPAYGARELTDLELFLAWRAQGLPVEAPGVRR
jgi:sulfur-oxidizing protein SoxA